MADALRKLGRSLLAEFLDDCYRGTPIRAERRRIRRVKIEDALALYLPGHIDKAVFVEAVMGEIEFRDGKTPTVADVRHSWFKRCRGFASLAPPPKRGKTSPGSFPVTEVRV